MKMHRSMRNHEGNWPLVSEEDHVEHLIEDHAYDPQVAQDFGLPQAQRVHLELHAQHAQKTERARIEGQLGSKVEDASEYLRLMEVNGERYGISHDTAIWIFNSILPDDVVVLDTPHEAYMESMLEIDAVKEQILKGIYDLETIEREFLSPACSWPDIRTVEVDTHLIRYHMSTVPALLAHGWVTWLALHESYHIREHTGQTPIAEKLRYRYRMPEEIQDWPGLEQECNTAIEHDHLVITRLARLAEEQSTSIGVVMKRIASLRPTEAPWTGKKQKTSVS